MMKKELPVIVVAITVIGILEAIALFKGIDGAYFVPAVSLISGLAGYEIKTAQIKTNP